MVNYKLFVGPAGYGVGVISIVTPRSIINLSYAQYKDGLELTRQEYLYALEHGLQKLVSDKVVTVVKPKVEKKQEVIVNNEVDESVVKETEVPNVEEVADISAEAELPKVEEKEVKSSKPSKNKSKNNRKK